MMNKAFIFLIIFSPLLIHAQECYWSCVAGGNGSDKAKTITCDIDGNTYMAGTTRGSFCYFKTDTIIPKGINDVFIVKYDNSGNELWIKQYGWYNEIEEDYESIGGITFDTIHNRLLVTGTFYQLLNLSDTTLYDWELAGFVLSMDTDGDVIWARGIVNVDPNGGEVRPFSITYDETGNIYVSGCNEKLVNFTGIEVPPGGFLAKYDQYGNVLWAKNKFRYWSPWPDPYNPFTEAPPYNILFDHDQLLVNGTIYNDTIIIDTITRITNPGYRASYLASFSRGGEIKYLTFAGGPSGSCGNQITVDDSGSIFITGIFKSTGYFGADTLLNQAIYEGDCFISKLDISGNFKWTEQLHATGEAWGSGVVTDRTGTVYLSGSFFGTAQFGETVLTSGSESYADMYLTHFYPDGDCIGVRQYTAGGLPALATDHAGNIYMAGSFYDTLVIGTNTFHSMGFTDMFIAHCSPITGIGMVQEKLTNGLLIYANPSTGVCNVTIPDEFSHEKSLRLQIFDQSGRMVQEGTIDLAGDVVRIDIRAQAKGLYHAVLTNGKKTYSGKIIFTGN